MEEFTVKAAPKIAGKKFNVFKMHKDDKISWTEAKMKRENDYQPWQIKLGSGRTARRFKAVKEGSVGENASYFIFFKPKNSKGPFEVCPVDEWYNMSATQRYKTLTAEEAEQKFEQRHKTLNMFSVMHKKNGDGGEEGGSSAGGSNSFKISEMDDWDHSGGDSDDDFGDEDETAKKKRRRATKKEKEEPEDAPEEGKEDSDEGDFEQREVDYMSDSSSESDISESGTKDNKNEVKDIADEQALRDLLSTDEDGDPEGSPQKSTKPNFNKNTLGTVDIKQHLDGSEESSDSDDLDDVDEDKIDAMFAKKALPSGLMKSESRTDQPDHPVTPTIVKQPLTIAALQAQSSKRKLDQTISSAGTSSASNSSKRPCPPEQSTSPLSSLERTIEELVKKYLRRKPVTLRALLKDIKNKLKRMDGLNYSELNHDILNTIAAIFKRLNPERQKIGDSEFFSLSS